MKRITLTVLFLVFSACAHSGEVTASLKWLGKEDAGQPMLSLVIKNNTDKDIRLDPNRFNLVTSLIIVDIEGDGFIPKVPHEPPLSLSPDNLLVLKAGQNIEWREPVSRITQVDLHRRKLIIYFDYFSNSGDDRLDLFPKRITSNVLVIDRLTQREI